MLKRNRWSETDVLGIRTPRLLVLQDREYVSVVNAQLWSRIIMMESHLCTTKCLTRWRTEFVVRVLQSMQTILMTCFIVFLQARDRWCLLECYFPSVGSLLQWSLDMLRPCDCVKTPAGMDRSLSLLRIHLNPIVYFEVSYLSDMHFDYIFLLSRSWACWSDRQTNVKCMHSYRGLSLSVLVCWCQYGVASLSCSVCQFSLPCYCHSLCQLNGLVKFTQPDMWVALCQQMNWQLWTMRAIPQISHI